MAASYSVVFNAPLSGVSGTVAVGYALVKTTAGYVIATAANRASYGRAHGVALTAGDGSDPGTNAVDIQEAGNISHVITSLGAGSASWVRVSSSGALERCTPSGSDDIVGWCEANGDLHSNFGFITVAMISGGAGAIGGSSGDVQVNSSGALAGVSPGTSGNVLTSNGSAWTSTAPTLTPPGGSNGDVQVKSGGSFAGVSPSTSGNVLTSNGSAWTSAPAASTPPGGSDGDVQIKSGTSFAGISPAAQGTVLRSNGSAWTTQQIVSFENCCTFEQFGAVGDGVTDDTAACHAAFDAVAAGTFGAVLVGAKTYLTDPYTWDGGAGDGGAVIGTGHNSVIKVRGATSGLTAMFLVRNTSSMTFRDLHFLGDGTTAQRGILAGLADSTAPQHLTIQNCWFEKFATSAIHLTNPPDATGQVAQILGCRIYGDSALTPGTRVGTGIVVGGELGMANVDIAFCAVGAEISAGNISWAGGTCNDNDVGIQLDASGNDGHGSLAGVVINHNDTFAIDCGALANGMTFSGCQISADAMRFTGNTGVVDFIGCDIEPTNLYFDGSLVRFIGCQLKTAVLVTVNDDYNSHPSRTEYIDCSDLAGNVPTFIGQRMQLAYTFPSDANQTLTPQQSIAHGLIIQNGVISTIRSITSSLTAAQAQSRTLLIDNQESFAVNFLWGSGAGVRIAPGRALIGSDGTNAVILLDGTGFTPTNTTLESGLPLFGRSALSSPFGCHGEVVTSAIPGGGTLTLAAADYAYTFIQVANAVGTTGGGGGNVEFPVPTTSLGYWKMVYNGTNAGITLQKVGGAGATVTLATGKCCIVWVTSGGVLRITPDT